MILNGAADIRLGETAVEAVYLGETLIWARGAPRFKRLDDYLDYYYAPARAAVWEREGFAAYVSGLWGIQTALRYVTPTVEMSRVACFAGSYRYHGRIGYATSFGYNQRSMLDTIPLIRAQHFAITAHIEPDDQVTLPWSFDTSTAIKGKSFWWKLLEGKRLTGAIRFEAAGILTDGAYHYPAPASIRLGFSGSPTIPTVDGGAATDYCYSAEDALFGAPALVSLPLAMVTRRTFADYIRNDYNAYYLRQYPALADLLFVPTDPVFGTWDDLAALCWDDASAYTWNEIGGN